MSHELILEGTLGVDARRAAAKIRDHLLANPATWLSELGRVAVLSGATRLAIDLRATSIVVEWNGEPIASEVIEQFGRHLLGDDEEVKPSSKHSRRARPDRRPELLTLAVFAALGDIAKAVDIGVAGEGDVARTRRLAREELEGALSGGTARVLSVPRGEAFCLLPDATGSVVLDLGARLGAFAHWLGIAAPPAAVRELGVRMGSGLAITVDGKPLEPAAETPVLSFELPPVGELSVRLDLLGAPPAEPRIVYYELGFEIARSSLLDPTLQLPIRVVVGGQQIPTNASRSQVDETVADNVKREAVAGLAVACEGLRAAIVAALGRDDEQARRGLEQVAGYLAAAALRANQADPFFKAFAPALDWPLLLDAAGRPLGVRDAERRADGYNIHCRVQKKPLPPEYAPLVADVLWRRGHSAEAAFNLLDYDTIAEDVEAGVQRKRHIAENAVPFEPPPCATARWSSGGKGDDGFEWKLALDTDSTGPCLVRIFVGDYLIETLEVEHKSPFYRYDAAVRWPDVVVAERTMAKMRVGHGSGRMYARLDNVLDESLLHALQTGNAQRPGAARLLALRLLSPSLKPNATVLNMPLWERAGGGYASTRELAESAVQRGHLFVLPRPLIEGEIAPGEPVIVVMDSERGLLCTVLGDAELCDYAPYANAPAATLESVKRYFSDAKLASHSFKWREYFVAVTAAASGRHVTLHRGLFVEDKELHNGRGMLLATDGETTLTDAAADHEALVKQAWLSFVAWLSESPDRMAAAITAPEVRSALLLKLAASLDRKPRPQLAFEEWPVFLLHTSLRAEHHASAWEILAHFGDMLVIPTVAPGWSYDSTVERVVASDRDRALLERIAKRPCVSPKQLKPDPDPPPPKVVSPPPESVHPDDLLGPLRQIMPSSRNIEPLPPEPPAKAPPKAAPVDPDDVLRPIRYLMTETKARHAADTKQKAERAPPPQPIVSPLLELSPIVPLPPIAEPTPPPAGAWDRLVGMFKKPLAEVPGDHPLATMGRRVTENLYVAGLQLRFGEASDAPVRFERATTSLVLNPEHPTVRVLLENADVVPLVAAAFSEINRELKVVSDEEERRALGRLLLDSPAT